MRLSLLSLLLLSAAAPALADPTPAEPSARAEASRSERPARVERAERSYRRDADAARPRTIERAVRATEAPPPPRRAERQEPRAAAPASARDVAAAAVAEQRRERWNQSAPDTRRSGWQGRGDGATGWQERRTERRGRQGDLPPTAGSPVLGSAVPVTETITRPRREVSPNSVAGRDLRDRIAAEGLRRDRIESEQWRREWRKDRRYDWRRYRDRDRARFHLGLYIDPFGWGYRDWDLGWRLPSRYFASRYWINDPFYYRLPPVGAPYRWVRYHDDVLLVDLRTGRVLDRIRDFFW